jgi:hemolysin III
MRFQAIIDFWRGHPPREWVSSTTHGIGMGLAVAGVIILIVNAVVVGTAWHVVSFAIYGASMIILFLASAVYHAVPERVRARDIWRRLDHASIYLLIAGTYTPLCLVSLRGPWGWSIFGVIWTIGCFGFFAKLFWRSIPSWLGIALYVTGGWIGVIAFWPALQRLPTSALWFILAGGIAYTGGVICYGLEKKKKPARYFGWHEAFHILVLVGAALHYWVMLHYVL